jgi:hypothetical protein
MSEPYSVLVEVTIERDALIAYLDATPRPAAAWSDWSRIGGEWLGFSWDKDLPRILQGAGDSLVGSHRDVIAAIIAAEDLPGCERCAFDAATRRFTFGTLMFSHNVGDIVRLFAAARGIGEFMRDGQSGFAVVLDYLWSEPTWTLAAMEIAAERSRFLDAQADAASWERYARAATAAFDDIKAAGGAADLVINNLDRLR